MKVADLLGRVKPVERTVRLSLDGSLAARIDDLEAEAKRARARDKRRGDGLTAEAPQLEQKLAELREAEEATATVFLFKAMPGSVLDAMVAAHPPTQEQLAEHREERAVVPWARPPEYDEHTIAPAIIAASIAAVDGEEVDWSEDDGKELWATLHDGARADLLEAAWGVNQRRSNRPTSGTGTDTTSSSGPDSTTPPSMESPSQSSTEGS